MSFSVAKYGDLVVKKLEVNNKRKEAIKRAEGASYKGVSIF